MPSPSSPAQPPPGRVRGLARKLGLSAATLLVCLLLLEVLLRLLGIGAAGRGSPWFAGGSHPRYLFQPDPAAGYALRPGFRGVEVAASGEFRVPVAVDRLGLRLNPRAGAVPADGERVLVLGDSMTFGEGVEAGETYPALLAAATGARVYNAGVPGYGSRQMAARLRELAPRLQPRVVLVTLQATWDIGRCANPFVYRDGYIVASSYRDRLYRVGDNLYASETSWPVLGPLTAYAKGWSNLCRLALPALHQAVAGRRRPSDHGPQDDDGVCLAALAAAAAEVQAAGARSLVVLADSPEAPFRRDTVDLAAELARRGVSYLALDDLFGHPAGGAPGLRYARDGHWNAAGHRQVARVLAPRLAAVLAPSPGSPR